MAGEQIGMKMDEQAFLAQELGRTMGQMRRFGKNAASMHGIRPSEFMLLNILFHYANPDSPGMKVSDLSARLQITPAGVTHMINSLEENNYVERLADPSDRRVVLVKATEKSQKILELIHSEHFEFLKGLVAFLGEKDAKELIRLLTLAQDYAK